MKLPFDIDLTDKVVVIQVEQVSLAVRCLLP